MEISLLGEFFPRLTFQGSLSSPPPRLFLASPKKKRPLPWGGYPSCFVPSSTSPLPVITDDFYGLCRCRIPFFSARTAPMPWLASPFLPVLSDPLRFNDCTVSFSMSYVESGVSTLRLLPQDHFEILTVVLEMYPQTPPR